MASSRLPPARIATCGSCPSVATLHTLNALITSLLPHVMIPDASLFVSVATCCGSCCKSSGEKSDSDKKSTALWYISRFC